MRPRPGAPAPPRVIATPATFAAARLPQIAAELVAGEFAGGMFSDGAIRVSHTTADSNRYTSGDLTPQRYLAPPVHTNDNLETAAQTAEGTARNVLNRRRGAGAR